jgi:trigger factor
MNITQESTGDLTATVCIEIEKADYAEKVEKKLRDYRQKMKMPGFREGKVPLGVVNKMYGKAVLAEEINTMISEALENHLNENNVETLASPLPNMERQQPIDFDTQDRFSFFFDVALRPEVQVDLEGLEAIKRYEITPDTNQEDEYIASIRKSYGAFEEVEKADLTDLVKCEIDELNDAGETFNGGIHAEGTMSIEKMVDDGIRQQFIGAEPGTTIRMNPMTAYQNRTEVASLLNIKSEELPEPLGNFDFKILSIKRHVPAEIDEKLLAEVFPNDNLQSEEELRVRVNQDIRASFAKESENKMYNDTIEALLAATPIDLPDEFLKRWLIESGEEKKTTPEDVAEHYDGYARQLRLAMIRNQIIVDYQLGVTEDDFYEYILKALGMPSSDEGPTDVQKETVSSIMANIMKDKKQAEKIGDRIMEEKISGVILNKVPYQTEQITSEAFTALLQV